MYSTQDRHSPPAGAALRKPMSENPAPPAVSAELSPGDNRIGFFYAIAAYLIWGFLPLYMKQLAHVNTVEVIAHRVIWSVPVALAVLWWTGRAADLKAAIKSPKMLSMASVTAALISLNWGIYVWAIGAGHALDAALGYYINPLFSVLLASVLLREKLAATQWVAIGVAAIGVAILTWENGGLPIVALSLTLTWGVYAYFKRSLPIGPNQGFALEVLLLLPIGLAVLVWLMTRGESTFINGTLSDQMLLLGCGIISAGPLILYANGAKRLRLSTIAMMQYIAPTMIFLTAVFVFDEPFSQTKLIAFGFIWAALVIFTLPMLRRN